MRILIASSIDLEALDTLRREHEVVCAYGASPEELQQRICGCEAVIFRSGVTISAGVMACAPTLRLLIRAGSGIDNLDLDCVQRHGLELVRIPGPGAQAVAEMSFALMLALSRNLLAADHSMREGRWLKHELSGCLLSGKVLGIVGVGNIGSRVAEMGVAWGMEVIGCVEHPSPARADRMSEKGIRLTDLGEVLTLADYVSIHVPLKDSTRNLIDADALAKMRPGSYLTNLARGGVVDEYALYCELVNGGRLCGAALDVHAEEGEGKLSRLASLPNVILTPHIGAATVDTQREIGIAISEAVRRFSGG